MENQDRENKVREQQEVTKTREVKIIDSLQANELGLDKRPDRLLSPIFFQEIANVPLGYEVKFRIQFKHEGQKNMMVKALASIASMLDKE